MPTIAKRVLSGSTNGRGILIAATATPGTAVHTAVTGTTDFDEVWLWATNTDTTARKLTIEYGGQTSPNDLIEFTVPTEDGFYLMVPGLVLNNGLIVTVFCATANVVTIHGFVNRITA
ncbi:MAG TPA: hypothetical protein VJA25_09340 [Dehalococcoidia bacterium]|nr:hypothetical protein [Dehalococcoidia bacterium]